jgi:hypothetical protein
MKERYRIVCLNHEGRHSAYIIECRSGLISRWEPARTRHGPLFFEVTYTSLRDAHNAISTHKRHFGRLSRRTVFETFIEY